ncbi:MAG: hypothetical protein RBU28_06960 [Bacteroidales bacterium]|jgi:hypothetical protein|nr:hypothetical protein [Bacteroidales bacterium]
MSFLKQSSLKIRILYTFLFISAAADIIASDHFITGTVTDINGAIVSGARILMTTGTTDYAAITGNDGTYSLRISGIYDDRAGTFQSGNPFPNPFSGSVYVPVIINTPGDIRFAVYNLSGQKVTELHFPAVPPGSYRIVWDGCNQNGAPQKPGFYIYAVNFKGTTLSGRLVKAEGFTSFSGASSLEPVMVEPVVTKPAGERPLPVITSVERNGYYSIRLTDIVVSRDTVIDFTLTPQQEVPFRTLGNNIAMHDGSDYRSLMLKGINLGSSPPGTFPGEIAYAISGDTYEEWIKMMGEAGFNSIRIYTLHPPVFYEKLAEYNYRHPENPLLLFQGIWLEEVEDRYDPWSYDLINRRSAFLNDIREVIDCVHGKGDLAFRYGKAYGRYLTDVSQWTAGYILGREISPQEIDSTDLNNPTLTSFTGNRFSINAASATEVFITEMLDETVKYEDGRYSVRRPVSISSWPTLDPLGHPTEIYTDEDLADFDITKISGRSSEPGIFASYHAYPYYPNFISQEPGYLSYSDAEGPNSYLGYLSAMKEHYNDIPLVIAEFGVPSSWGSAHQSYSEMHHGGYSERQQGEKNVRMMQNIVEAGCAGGFMFAWMDEWFKPTWIVSYLEALGIVTGEGLIPTRQLWHNLTSPEQNFGLVSYDQTGVLPYVAYHTDRLSGPVNRIEATHDNSWFMVKLISSSAFSPGDTVMIAFDTYRASTGESQLPNEKQLVNRSEFLLQVVLGNDSSLYCVTGSYDMKGLTPRFDLSDHSVQKFMTLNSDDASWRIMEWINDGFELTSQEIGRLPVENNISFTKGERSAVAWSGNSMIIRIPWTMLYFHDPTQMKIINGAESYDGGYNYDIFTTSSDGIALSVYHRGIVTSTLDRYNWEPWLIVPPTITREKKSLQIVSEGIAPIPDFVD